MRCYDVGFASCSSAEKMNMKMFVNFKRSITILQTVLPEQALLGRHEKAEMKQGLVERSYGKRGKLDI